jgi:hypothetical protein
MSAVTGDHVGPPPDERLPLSPPGDRSAPERRWDQVRWGLLVCWLIVAGATVLTGERASSWDQVETLVAAGEVNAVRVAGELPAGATGYGEVEVHWRHGPLKYRAEVLQVRGTSALDAEPALDDARVALVEPPSSLLAAAQPGLQVTHDQQRWNSSALVGWQVPSWLGLFAALLFVAGLFVLIAGPQPWRATRWAWFWLQLPPLGAIAFLLASGPIPGAPHPGSPHRRLTGGWAFLLSIALTGILKPYLW